MNIKIEKEHIVLNTDSKQFQLLLSKRGSALIVQYYGNSTINTKENPDLEKVYIADVKQFIEWITECYNLGLENNFFYKEEGDDN